MEPKVGAIPGEKKSKRERNREKEKKKELSCTKVITIPLIRDLLQCN